MHTEPPTGFIGLGTMGTPMAQNLVRSGHPLVVWNRTAARCAPLAECGATVAADADDLFARCGTVLLMLENEAATDAVLGRGTEAFSRRVAGHCIVAMGTTSATYSHALSHDITAAGGRYVEAPVSGSRKPAEAGQLVGMVAGAPDDVDRMHALLAPICKQVFECGAVPAALQMKLAVNTFLITMVTGLAEAGHFAARHGLDMDRFADILNAGPMASDVSRVKVDKLRTRDFSRQAGISDVLKNSRLVVEAARAAGTAHPLMALCAGLYEATEAMGAHEQDMIAVIRAFEAQAASASPPSPHCRRS
ncbi:NAD(P)-dependent oxidoreductase [Roseospira marina]|uniref:NAD(P)-dependent oxidoreductase n=1 Tax=Roseospira marina TaxID=140057 RepID=A0A5M6IE36_9PROT|nr:NAD(P)-dependent oxidoreductase [Roseospira marina]KAA5606551.1 NAD(P)-dependent oxidoreductase [Roseospira marina]MBB4314019.1 3-hydroxyisobutyrate dehydrogenase [Roseospira marina]MBB5087180.1 3-hydroxyisobutyrate dehydrogenase [Roseospira marina]